MSYAARTTALRVGGDGLVVERNIHVVGKRAAVGRDIVSVIQRNVGGITDSPGSRRWRRRSGFSTERAAGAGKIAARR